MDRLRILNAHLSGAHIGGDGQPLQHALTEAQAQEEGSISVSYQARSGINGRADYERLHAESLRDPAGFWGRMAEDFYWQTKFPKDHVGWNFDLQKASISMHFFKGGKTNMSYNCLDRHVKRGHGDRTCFFWEGNEYGEDRQMSYREVLQEVSRVANYLKSIGVKKGDSVVIYMSLTPELPIAMLACTRLGAVHSVVFGGFSAESLSQRIVDSRATVVITGSAGLRGSKVVELKAITDAALKLAAKQNHTVSTVLVWEHARAKSRGDTPMTEGRDVWWSDTVDQQANYCAPVWVDAEAPLFLLYTSGSTGNPKGVLHTTGGYMVQTAVSAKYIFDLQPGDVFWCTADPGWVTGHTYLTYGPMCNGVSQVIYEGVPAYPKPDRVWRIVDKYRVRALYTSPTLLRALQAHGDEWVKKSDLSSLKILGTVGEPINPAAWEWFFKVVGKSRCPIVDTWWQTETGSCLIVGLPGAWAMKPGCATLPFFGVNPVLVDEKGKRLPKGPGEGILAIEQPWPSMMRTLRGDHERFEKTYFSTFNGKYFTGDGAKIDKDGYIWITGRVDDVINVSGHRVGTAEVESALCSNEEVVEAAVVGIDHKIKGQGLYAYITLHDGVKWGDALKKKLTMSVRSQIGAFAAPDGLHYAPGLPKTRSGKILRRVLRKIATNEENQLGDLSTLNDPEVINQLLGKLTLALPLPYHLSNGSTVGFCDHRIFLGL